MMAMVSPLSTSSALLNGNSSRVTTFSSTPPKFFCHDFSDLILQLVYFFVCPDFKWSRSPVCLSETQRHPFASSRRYRDRIGVHSCRVCRSYIFPCSFSSTDSAVQHDAARACEFVEQLLLCERFPHAVDLFARPGFLDHHVCGIDFDETAFHCRMIRSTVSLCRRISAEILYRAISWVINSSLE